MNSRQGIEVLAGLEPYLSRDCEIVGADLEAYAILLSQWQKVQNLVSRETMPDIWQRHMRDSLQLLRYLDDDRVFVDLGSGGGFPAIPLSIALKSEQRQFHLIEANRRKASFLRTVGRELNLSVTVHHLRAEQVDPQIIGGVDVITSRATAPLVDLLGLAIPFWGRQTRSLFHKGRECGEEVTKAGSEWLFDVIRLDSETDPDGGILEIRNLRALSDD